MGDKAHAKSKGNTARRANQRNNGKPSGMGKTDLRPTFKNLRGCTDGQRCIDVRMLVHPGITLHEMMRRDKLIRRWTRAH